MKQNTRTIAIFFSLLSLIILGNCEKDSSSFEESLQPQMENRFSIFDNINVVQSQNGELTIVSPEDHVKKRLSEIFIEKTACLARSMNLALPKTKSVNIFFSSKKFLPIK